MGYVSGYDENDEHEGWVVMTYADGRISSGTSCGAGHYLDGYTYLPRDDNDAQTWGRIDPAFLRPDSAIVGWMPRCECGWAGVEVPLPAGESGREPNGDEEDLLMSQWRLHLRDVYPAYSGRCDWSFLSASHA